MKKILLLGKVNDTLQDLHAYLSGAFRVQLSTENTEVLSGMIRVFQPDLVLISLVGAYDFGNSVFRHLSVAHSGLPVLTIGTEKEREAFLKYYEDEQFENLIRPVENRAVYEAVCRRLNLDTENPGRELNARKHILVVDDNAQMLRNLKTILEESYEITLANSGMKAMTSIGKSRPDLILLDYEMPVCDGRQTLEMIRADEEIADIPVIFLTGVGDREHIEAVLALKPSGYLLKPASSEALLEAIEKALEEK